MKHRTLINTQCLENYGAHDANGKFVDGNGYWKFKGGEQYIISSNENRPANAVAFLSAMLQKDNNSLYSKEYATFEEENVYRQADAEGFIRLNSLRLRLHTLRKEGRLNRLDDSVLKELSDYIE